MMGVWGDIYSTSVEQLWIEGVGLDSGCQALSWMPLSNLYPQRNLSSVNARSLSLGSTQGRLFSPVGTRLGCREGGNSYAVSPDS